MAYTFEYNSEIKAVEITFEQHVSGPEVREAATNAIKLLKKHRAFKALINTTRLEVAPDIIDIYDLPINKYEEEDLSRQTKLALIVPELTKVGEAANFFETVSVNWGWLVRSFSTRDEALEWLNEGYEHSVTNL
jgi:hypothetical protein